MDPAHDAPRRLVLALPAAPLPRPVIDRATRLASLLSAELLGLFVEDANLLAMAALSFARQFDARARAWRSIDPTQVQQDYAAIADTLRRQLTESAAALGIAADFAVTRGQPHGAVIGGAARSDVVAWFEPLSNAWRRASGAAAASLYLPTDTGVPRGPVVALVARDEPDEPAVVAATRIARRAARALVTVDLAREAASDYWFGRSARRGRPLSVPGIVPAAVAGVPRSGLPPASMVIVSRALLQRDEARVLALAESRPEPWLVLER